MNKSILQQCIQKSLAGTMSFPEVVRQLSAEGIESYHVDLVRAENRYYMPDGTTLVEAVPFVHNAAADTFSAEGLALAVKTIQAGAINYQEFLNRILAAGCVYYIVYLKGKRVSYLGRNGDCQTEFFPQQK